VAELPGTYVQTNSGIWVSGKRVGGAVVVTPGADDFELRMTRPSLVAPDGAHYAGLPAGWAPKQTFSGTSPQIIGSNTILEDIQFDCPVTFQGTGIQMRRCWVRGAPSTTGRPMLAAYHSSCYYTNGPRNIVERCLLEPQNVMNTNDSIMGMNLWTIRSEMRHGVDGSGSLVPSSVGTVLHNLHQGDWLHDMAYFCPDVGGQATGQTHNDTNQHHDGVDEIWEGCDVSGYFAADVGVGATDPGVNYVNSAGKTVMSSGNVNSIGVANGPRNSNAAFQMNVINIADDIHYLYNWVDGGIAMFNYLDDNMPNNAAGALHVEFTGNRIGRPLNKVKNSILQCYSASTVLVTASGNTNLADGTPLSLAVGDGRYNKN
jgi:hypothetical protein